VDFIRTLISANHEIILFAYGLVFFILGLAIALQSRSYSRLDLARSLSWLSAFGFTHGLFEWGDLFIPIQSTYLSPSTITLLHDIHLLLLALSFAFLFEFGVTLLRPLGRARWLYGMPSVLLAIWVFVVYFPLVHFYPDMETWQNVANALARYFIGVPGGLIAAYGLRQHTFDRIVPLQVPKIVKMLQFAGFMLVLYSFFGGLIPPPIPFFPGNLLNSQTLEQVTAAPPPVYRSIIGLGLALAIIRALEVFDLETRRMIESMEQQQILAAERDRIARELHDGAIQKVYTAGLLVESAQSITEKDSLQARNRLEKAKSVLNEAINDLRRNLSELHNEKVQEPLPEALKRLAEDPRFRSLVDVSLSIDIPDTVSMSPIREDHVLAIVNEALSNAVRHAKAHEVNISARYEYGRLYLDITDDGTGLPKNLDVGYGLRNMHDRARLLGGAIDIRSLDGKGTKVSLDVPWEERS
jgi:signal transduction histidine kinase